MAQFQEMECPKCKHYEAYHHYPNPNAVAPHYCKKCKEEICYRRVPGSDFYVVWLPKACYWRNFFEESEESKKEREERFSVPTGFANGYANQVD